jgi:hypothetical protein
VAAMHENMHLYAFLGCLPFEDSYGRVAEWVQCRSQGRFNLYLFPSLSVLLVLIHQVTFFTSRSRPVLVLLDPLHEAEPLLVTHEIWLDIQVASEQAFMFWKA